jgi:hypothetical protein
MKIMKKFQSFKRNNPTFEQMRERLISKGWYDVDYSRKDWTFSMQYDLGDNIYLTILNIYPEEDDFSFPIYTHEYLDEVNRWRYLINTNHKFNGIKLFSNIESDIDRVIKLGEYIKPYFLNKPSKEDYQNIKDIFSDLDDILGKPEIDWGYYNPKISRDGNFNESLIFPPIDEDFKLGVSLLYNNCDVRFRNTTFDLFKESKRGFDSLGINPTDAYFYWNESTTNLFIFIDFSNV